MQRQQPPSVAVWRSNQVTALLKRHRQPRMVPPSREPAPVITNGDTADPARDIQLIGFMPRSHRSHRTINSGDANEEPSNGRVTDPSRVPKPREAASACRSINSPPSFMRLFIGDA